MIALLLLPIAPGIRSCLLLDPRWDLVETICATDVRVHKLIGTESVLENLVGEA